MKIEIEVNAPGLEAAINRFAEALENHSTAAAVAAAAVAAAVASHPADLKQEVEAILPAEEADTDAAAEKAEQEKKAAAAAKRKAAAEKKKKAEAAKKAAEEAAAAAEAADDETPGDEPDDAPAAAYTLEKVRQLVSDYSTGSPAATTKVKEAFADFNVRKLSEIDPADYEELLDKLGLI